jgi:hypothetical protein
MSGRVGGEDGQPSPLSRLVGEWRAEALQVLEVGEAESGAKVLAKSDPVFFGASGKGFDDFGVELGAGTAANRVRGQCQLAAGIRFHGRGWSRCVRSPRWPQSWNSCGLQRS